MCSRLLSNLAKSSHRRTGQRLNSKESRSQIQSKPRQVSVTLNSNQSRWSHQQPNLAPLLATPQVSSASLNPRPSPSFRTKSTLQIAEVTPMMTRKTKTTVSRECPTLSRAVRSWLWQRSSPALTAPSPMVHLETMSKSKKTHFLQRSTVTTTALKL